MKTASLSVRVDDDDAAFLAALEIEDARTPSEKLRALLHAERRRQEGVHDPVEAADMFRDLLKPAKRGVRRREMSAEQRSDFLAKLYERLPEIAGGAFAGPDARSKDLAGALKKFEAEMLDEVFAFIQETLELGLTTRARCHDPAAFEKRLAPVLEILELMNMSRKRRKGDG
ncbi:MAG: hypothetical protein AAGA09_02825 [Pseudomonadota bacterium]